MLGSYYETSGTFVNSCGRSGTMAEADPSLQWSYPAPFLELGYVEVVDRMCYAKMRPLGEKAAI